MKKTYLLWFACLAFLMVGCRNENFNTNETNNDQQALKFRVVPKSEIPKVMNALQAKTNNFKVPLGIHSSAMGKAETVFGEINTNYIIETTNGTDEVYYTFSVSPYAEYGSETYNLEVRTDNTDASDAKVIVYEPTVEWLLNGNNDYLTFSGNKKTYSLEGTLENTVVYAAGNPECPPPPEPCPDCPSTPGGPGGGPGGNGGGIPGGGAGGGGGTGTAGDDPDGPGGPSGPSGGSQCPYCVSVDPDTGNCTQWIMISCPGSLMGKQVRNCPTNGGGGVVIVANDPCAKTSITSANNILKNSEVKSKMDAVLKSKRNATNEFAVSVGKNGNSYNVTPPKEGDQHSGTIPPVMSGDYVADGHSHPNGSYGTPSAGDFYNFILKFPSSQYLESRFVYGSYFGDAEVYALVVHSKAMAQNFVNLHPKSENYNDTTAMFIENSTLGIEYKKAVDYANIGTYQNTTDEYYSSSAMALAYVLSKFNTGISLAKVDANGNLKKVNVNIETITVSGGNGTPKTGLKITKCP